MSKPTAGLPSIDAPRTTSEAITDLLRQAIVRGALRAGEELNQVALARHFGVSRVPIREALRQLQAEGLVMSRPHMRSVVQALPSETIVEILEVRALLEGSLVERSLGRVDDATLAELTTLCDSMDAAPTHDDWLAGNREFHERLAATAGATLTVEILRQLSGQIERYLRVWTPTRPERQAEANAEHRRVVEALARGDARRARRELEHHIERTSALSVGLVERSRLDADDTRDGAGATGDLEAALEGLTRQPR